MSPRPRSSPTVSHVVDGRGVGSGPESVVRVVQVATVVERDGLEEHAYSALVPGESYTLTKQLWRIRRMTGNAQRDAGDVSKHRDRVVVVEVAAEALLVREAGDSDHHGIPILAIGEEREEGRFTAYLIFRVVKIG